MTIMPFSWLTIGATSPDNSRAIAAQEMIPAETRMNRLWPRAARSSAEVWPNRWSSSAGRDAYQIAAKAPSDTIKSIAESASDAATDRAWVSPNAHSFSATKVTATRAEARPAERFMRVRVSAMPLGIWFWRGGARRLNSAVCLGVRQQDDKQSLIGHQNFEVRDVIPRVRTLALLSMLGAPALFLWALGPLKYDYHVFKTLR